jgi:hypothetical protein
VVARIVAIITLPPLIAALLTMMLMAPNGPVNTKLMVFMFMLVILTMTVKGIDVYRAAGIEHIRRGLYAVTHVNKAFRGLNWGSVSVI